jgi:replicative DNA helicase
MSSFNDTVDLERAFLKAIITSAMMARTYIHQGREEMFTSDERQTIFALATKAMDETNSVLTKTVFEYEVKSKLEDSILVSIMCEWDLIDAIDQYDPPELTISKMKEAAVGRKALSVSEDIMAMLQKGQIKDAVSHLKRAAMMIGDNKEDRPMVELTETKDRAQLIEDKQRDPMKYKGIKIGFKTFDDHTGGLYKGELLLIAGVTGLGKSTLCRSIAKGIVTHPDNGCKNVLHIANEEYLEQVQYKYDAVFTGIPYLNFKKADITPEEVLRWQKYMSTDMKAPNRGRIFVKEVPAFTDVSLVEQCYRQLENAGVKIDVVIIDHLPHVKPISQAWGENDERAKAAADCKELARWLRVAVITPTQAATEVDKKQMAGKRAGKMDVYGSKGQIHVANTFVIITYKGTDDTQQDRPDYSRDVFWLCDAKKNRDGPPFYFLAKHQVHTGQVDEIVDESKKPDKTVQKAVADITKDILDGNTKTTASTAPEAILKPSVSLGTGLRDASMDFAQKVEDEDDEDEASVSALEMEAVKRATQGSVQESVEEINKAAVIAELNNQRMEDARLAQIPKKSTLLSKIAGNLKLSDPN